MDKTTRLKKPAGKDWSASYTEHRLKDAGWNFAKLARHHGYASRSTFLHAVARPWPKGERLLAEAIGVAPETIWPSRYQCNADGTACNGRRGEMKS